jgi:hypothetical protein
VNVVVFLGPTLPAEFAMRILDATYLPPARQGDVLRAALKAPKVIAIVDGYFERVPAVWHKEILFAMSRGIHVFGASSMGALRAAELAEFGMEGVGEVYDDFASGLLDADDEVAIAHASAEDGYRSSSEALVNIRATLRDAWVKKVVSKNTHDTLLAIAKRAFYADRSYPALFAQGRKARLPEQEIDELTKFVARGRIDQKQQDAIELLQVVHARLSAGLPPKRVLYSFEHTDAWEHMLSTLQEK